MSCIEFLVLDRSLSCIMGFLVHAKVTDRYRVQLIYSVEGRVC
jgi:hypothetical protein